MAASKSDFDSPWKDALEQYFPDFMQLLAPDLYEHIDWAHPIKFLDKELQAVSHDSANGKRYTDKLVEVRSQNNAYFWILVHAETQSDRITRKSLATFSERMYQYNHRIHDHYGHVLLPPDQPPQPVGLISLGVLTAGKSTDTELVYQRDVLGLCHTQFRFPVVYLANWLDRWNELKQLAATNPFAVLIMAQLQSQQADKDERQKLLSKTEIMRWLYSYGYSGKDTKQLLRLVDWLLITPPKLEAELKQAMIAIEQEHKMAYVTTFERIARREARQELREEIQQEVLKEAREEGGADILIGLLTHKFGKLSPDVQERLNHATIDQLQAWSLNILNAKSLNEVFTHQD